MSTFYINKQKGTPMERYSNIPKVCHDINLMPYIIKVLY